MSNIIFDNVFSTEVTKDCINIRFGVCDEEIIKKKMVLAQLIFSAKKTNGSSLKSHFFKYLFRYKNDKFFKILLKNLLKICNFGRIFAK